MLYVVGTPIGNIKDITLRALETLKEVDLILAEDTRQTIKILNKYEIKTKLKSYHKHNENKLNDSILNMLKDGKNIALVSDAGMPIVSDPGNLLVSKCIEQGLEVTTVPSATALISALILSGFDASEFTFLAFLPNKSKDRKSSYEFIKNQTIAVIFYEAPHRIKKTLKELSQYLDGERKVAIVREITKLYEQTLVYKISDWENYLSDSELKGEIVVVVDKAGQVEHSDDKELMSLIPIEKHLQYYLDRSYSKNESIKKVAKDRGLDRREVYDMFVK